MAVAKWSSSNPPAAAERLLQSTTEPLASDWRPVMDPWVHQDPVAAAEWLNTLKPGPAFDGAASAFASSLSSTDHLLALKWAQVVENPIERMQALRQALTHWYQVDPDTALAWTNQSGLPTHLLGLPAEDTTADPPVLLPPIMER